MTISTQHDSIFREGSRTYHASSMFFPRPVRRDVGALYAFVRTADDLVDAVPQDARGFRSFRHRYEQARRGRPAGDLVIDPFVELERRHSFQPVWVDAFLDAMESDLAPRAYHTVEDTLGYVYGSAEVVGLFMARILNLPDETHPHARFLGRAMQYINFIRDIQEDLDLGRQYLPVRGTPLAMLERQWALAHPREFEAFLRYHLDLYETWQKQAEPAFALIPAPYRLPIKTASDMYAWTAGRIRRNPTIVFRRKVKPRKTRIVLRALVNAAVSLA